MLTIYSVAGEKLPLEKMKLALHWQPTLEELCALPVKKVWFQLGIWLGVDEQDLQDINYYNKIWPDIRVRCMFQYFLRAPICTKGYAKFFKSLAQKTMETLFHQLFSEQLKYCQEVVEKLSEEEMEIIQEAFQNVQQQTEKLIVALVKVGLREVAEKICQSKGLIPFFVIIQILMINYIRCLPD